ncbi:baculoviral IAP repeat-containing protein 7-like [Pecten maximus]|uniref:baculoviral IAP repeat-containing protein 7-like n=1 Tax=Pecten maximus TaxID=6579 RepID=UPI0014589728|nr:baculoviral IAP repeat-containing protein 7-like [Pecten maximus]XP_033739527.1 baculoviral IAP repeat-containing protein 7-like [Pecten maximus]
MQRIPNNSDVTAREETVRMSENIIVGVESGHPPYPIRNAQYREERIRRESYIYWPQTTAIDIDSLVSAGFFYTGEYDIVRCFHCDIGIGYWNPTCDPYVEHARYRPDCPLLKHEKGQEWIDNIQTKGAQKYTPKNSRYQRKDDRQRSFQNEDWQRNNPSQCPEHLAAAGYFLEGDIVRCHYCDVIWRGNWHKDEPWMEHAQTFPFCKFLQKQKRLESNKIFKINSLTMVRPDHYLPVATGPEGYAFRLSCMQEFRIRVERDPMWSAAAQSLLSLGYSKESVSRAIHLFLNENPERREFDAGSLFDNIQRYEDALSENRQLRQRFQCKLCHERNFSGIAVPCGHLGCQHCLAGLTTCTICHSEIRENVRIYIC